MFDRIEFIDDIKLIACFIDTNLAENRTKELWMSFRPRLNEIKNTIGKENYSVHVYQGALNSNTFTPQTNFKIWAAIAVSDHNSVLEGMGPLSIGSGKYAVIIHKGTVLQFPKTAQYIYMNWLPSSMYELDNRAHFEIMKEDYLGPMDENSEEEVWIPIK